MVFLGSIGEIGPLEQIPSDPERIATTICFKSNVL
jgi:hypothetical protein